MIKTFLSLLFLLNTNVSYSLPPHSFLKYSVNSVSELKSQVKLNSVRYKLQKGLNLNDQNFDYTINSLVLTKTKSTKSCKVYYYNENKSPSIGCKTLWVKAGTEVFSLPNGDIVLLKICGNICIENKKKILLEFAPNDYFEYPKQINLPEYSLDYNDFTNISAPEIRTINPLISRIPSETWLPNYPPILIELPDKEIISIKHKNKYQYLFFGGILPLFIYDNYSSNNFQIGGPNTIPETDSIQIIFILFIGGIYFGEKVYKKYRKY